MYLGYRTDMCDTRGHIWKPCHYRPGVTEFCVRCGEVKWVDEPSAVEALDEFRDLIGARKARP